jgi:hypothetical protein
MYFSRIHTQTRTFARTQIRLSHTHKNALSHFLQMHTFSHTFHTHTHIPAHTLFTHAYMLTHFTYPHTFLTHTTYHALAHFFLPTYTHTQTFNTHVHSISQTHTQTHTFHTQSHIFQIIHHISPTHKHTHKDILSILATLCSQYYKGFANIYRIHLNIFPMA